MQVGFCLDECNVSPQWSVSRYAWQPAHAHSKRTHADAASRRRAAIDRVHANATRNASSQTDRCAVRVRAACRTVDRAVTASCGPHIRHRTHRSHTTACDGSFGHFATAVQVGRAQRRDTANVAVPQLLICVRVYDHAKRSRIAKNAVIAVHQQKLRSSAKVRVISQPELPIGGP